MRGERGFALVVTLIITALLVALLVEFVNEVYVDTSHSKNFVASQQAEILAESGIAGGIKLLQFSSSLRKGNYSSLLELWAKSFPYETEVGTVTISIEEESGKLDLNSATTQTGTLGTSNEYYQQTLARLFTNLKLPPELYEALADWADTDDTPRPNGAESNYYLSLKPSYQAHNNRFDTLEELALVRGFTPEVLAKLRPYVTVYGSGLEAGAQTAEININTAPKELLAALHDDFMRGDQVERILEHRKTKPVQNLTEVSGLETLGAALTLKVGCKGTTYRIRSEGKVGESVSVAEAVVTKIDELNPTVLYWREY